MTAFWIALGGLVAACIVAVAFIIEHEVRAQARRVMMQRTKDEPRKE